MLFIEYPKCTTCMKAKKWLDDNNVKYDDRHIVIDNPKKEELKEWLKLTDKPIEKFFNTSGLIYKNNNIKEKLPTMTMDEKIEMLSQNGMLVKRPLVVGDDFILIGFKEEEWKEKLK